MTARWLQIGLLFISQTAFAHLAGVTDTHIEIGHSTLSLVYTLPSDRLKELHKEAGKPIERQIAEGFIVKNDEALCSVDHLQQHQLPNIASQQFAMQFDCGSKLQTLIIDYALFVE